jgi:hypothetical protein
VEDGDGLARSQIIDREKAWSSVNHSIPPGTESSGQAFGDYFQPSEDEEDHVLEYLSTVESMGA